MRLDFSNSRQAVTFLLSVALGAVLCLCYDLFRLFYKRFSSKRLIFFGDVIFLLLSGFATFCFFLLFSFGMIRVYVYFGELFGFILCRATLSRLFFPLLCRAVRLLEGLLRLIKSGVERLFSPIVGKIVLAFRCAFGKIIPILRKNFKKTEKRS